MVLLDSAQQKGVRKVIFCRAFSGKGFGPALTPDNRANHQGLVPTPPPPLGTMCHYAVAWTMLFHGLAAILLQSWCCGRGGGWGLGKGTPARPASHDAGARAAAQGKMTRRHGHRSRCRRRGLWDGAPSLQHLPWAREGEGGGWHVALDLLFSSAAGGAHRPIAIRCSSRPFP